MPCNPDQQRMVLVMAEDQQSIVCLVNQVFGVYTHARPDGTIFYVGKGNKERAYYLGRHNRSKWHHSIVCKYGAENIRVIFILCSSEEEAFAKERELIKFYRSIGVKLINMTDGGEGMSNPSPEIRAKLSAARKGNKHNIGRKHSKEIREKLSKLRLGKKCKKETIEKIRNAQKERKLSPEHIAALKKSWQNPERIKAAKGKFCAPHSLAKMNAATRGKPKSPEHRAKLSKSLKGKSLSQETIAKLKVIKNSDKFRAENSARIKELWSDPIYREKMMQAHRNRKPISEETRNKLRLSTKASWLKRKANLTPNY